MVHCTYTINMMYQKDYIGNFDHIRTSEDKLSFKDSSTPGSRYPRVTELSFELGLFNLLLKQKALLTWDE